MLDVSSRLDSMGTDECVAKVDNMLVVHRVIQKENALWFKIQRAVIVARHVILEEAADYC
ncbi:hypothetical protein HanRHA438_Chr02g0092491 [Helianthus annuus]|nr:hypothetical protein HanRHA438_Chr02g0092491 [Helianthus annuus]